MLAVVKKPHIELSLGGDNAEIAELLALLKTRYEITILASSEQNEEPVDIHETDFWRENATPGRILAGYRHKHALTQIQLAEKCGIHHVVISAYENGKRRISQRAAVRIARALGEDEDTFFMRLCGS